MRWAREHPGTVAAWVGMALTMIAGAAGQMALTGAAHDQAQADIAELAEDVEDHDREIGALKSDVRSVREQQARLEEVVDRTEGAVRQMEQATAELRAVVRTVRGRE